jgi:TPR repeat protein
MTRIWIALFALVLFSSAAAAQAPAQGAAAKECLRLDAQPADTIPWGQHERVYKQWAAICREAMTTDAGDIRIKQATARALSASGQADDQVKLLRELAAQNDADSYLAIYERHKSFDGGQFDRPMLVTRAEAEQSLRKAAELGQPYATMMLAVLLDRGATVKRDNAEAIHWAERAVKNPPKDDRPIDMQVLLARLLVKSDQPEQRARGLDLLEKLGNAGRGDAKAYLAGAIRAGDPVRARKLLEEGMRGYAGAALPTLADMLIKGEGGPADPKRAVSLLSGRSASDVPGVKGALGQLYLDGKLLPRDVQKAAELISLNARWEIASLVQLMGILAANPEVKIARPEGILYKAIEASELGEPGVTAALIELKLSQSAQFRDKAGGCALAEKAAKQGDAAAAKRLPECKAN